MPARPRIPYWTKRWELSSYSDGALKCQRIGIAYVLAKECDLLKIDCEGVGFDILDFGRQFFRALTRLTRSA